MYLSFVSLLVGGISTFLIGANIGMIYRFWPEPWFTTKLTAATLLIATTGSMMFNAGPLSWWRLDLGLLAVVVDCLALYTVYRALEDARTGDGVLVAYRRR